MTPRATPEQVAQLEEASEAIRARAAHLRALAVELDELVEEDVEDEHVLAATRRLESLDQYLIGELALDDAQAGIPGLDQILEAFEMEDAG